MIIRRETYSVMVGDVMVGSSSPIVVQSMTNTDTADIKSTVTQIKELADAGSELVRITVNNDESAAAVAEIRANLDDMGCHVPIIGDFHYNGHTLLENYPDMAQSLAKYRINPGNVGFGKKQDKQFSSIVEQAIKHDKPVRIGVNWGSLDQQILKRLMDDNAKVKNPLPADAIKRQAVVASALDSAEMAEKIGLPKDKIIISCKVSNVQDLILIYGDIAKKCKYPLHLGLTEAGIGSKGIVASTAALSVLLQQGIGDTIRISLTPRPNESRTEEVIVASEMLQVMGLRYFVPLVTACPGCGRTTNTYFQELADDIQSHLRERMIFWKQKYSGVAEMKVAVMGCIVNGPGESKEANIGISLPGTGESPVAPVFEDGKKTHTLRGDNITAEIKGILENYVERTYDICG